MHGGHMVYGPLLPPHPLQSLFLLTISTFLPFYALQSSPPSLSMGGCFFSFSLLPTPPGLPLLWQPPLPFTPLPDHSVPPACVCLSPNFIQSNRAGQLRRNQIRKKSKTGNKNVWTNKHWNISFPFLLSFTFYQLLWGKRVIAVFGLPFQTDRSSASRLRWWYSPTDPRQRSSLSSSPAGKNKKEKRSKFKQTREDTLFV